MLETRGTMPPLVAKKQIQLKVVEAMQDDAYKGITRIDSEIMRELDIKKGDVIVFWGSASEPIIHRVVKIDNTYQTKGDHNSGSRGDEMNITEDKILGRAVLRIPYLGWLKLIFMQIVGRVI